MPTVACPRCGQKVRIEESGSGTVVCPGCRAKLVGKPRANGAAAAEPPGGRRDNAEKPPQPAASRPAVESAPPDKDPDRDADRDADRKPKRRPKGRGKGMPAWVLWSAIGGGVAVLGIGIVVLAILVVAFTPTPPAAPAKDANLDAFVNAVVPIPIKKVNDAPISIGPARKPKAPPISQRVNAAPAPEPGKWAVTADGVPLAKDLRSVFAVDLESAYSAFFSSPETAQAALLGKRAGSKWMHWAQYDLRRSADAVATVDVPAFNGSMSIGALSPDGQRLALAGSLFGEPPPGSEKYPLGFKVFVWGKDGKRLAVLDDPAPDRPYDWVGWTDDSHVATLRAGKLRVREVPSAKEAAQGKETYDRSLTLSPGRRWLAVRRGAGIDVLRAGDLTPAGRIELPAELPPLRTELGIAFSPDGTALAAAAGTEVEEQVLVWDVATGKLRDALALPLGGAGDTEAPRIEWTGPRQLCLHFVRRNITQRSAILVDLDVGAIVCQYDLGSDFLPGAPDGRSWRIVYSDKVNREGLWKLARGAVPAAADVKGKPRPRDPFLCAGSTVGDKLREKLDLLKGGTVVTRRTPVRAEAQAEGDAFRARAAESLADQLAEWGYEVDPAAKRAVRFTFLPAEITEEIGDVRKGDVIDVLARSDRIKDAYAAVDGRIDVVEDGKIVWSSAVTGSSAKIAPLTVAAAVQAGFHAKAAQAREKVLDYVEERNYGLFFPYGFAGQKTPDPLLVLDKEGQWVVLPFRLARMPIEGVDEPAVESITPKRERRQH
jgi:DNA-directed RNA polymerase subunit RPC12/RpoP